MYKSSRPINPANSSANRKKPFEDVVCGRTEIPSDWKKRIANKSKKSIQTQTTDELYNLQEAEVQTGRYTNIYQAQVEPKNTSTTLIEYIHNNQYKFTTNVTTSNKRNKVSTGTSTTDWVQQIEDGFVTVDCEVEREPHSKVEEETFIEYVDIKKHMGVQTEKQADYLPSNRDTSEGKTESKTSDDNDGGKEDNNNTSSNNTFTEYAPLTQPQRLLRFLEDVCPMMIQAINENNEVDAFEYLRHTTSSSVATNTLDTTSDPTSPSARNTYNSDNFELTYNKTTLWKCLTVDLEKKKVIFPDWTKAKHFPGIILKVTTTRNKERIYDIEYDDGSKYYGVREEYLRLLESSSRRSSNTTGAAGSKGRANNPSSAPNNASNTRVFEGMRVHCKVTSKSGISKYYLGRIVKVQGKSLYDVEIFETSRIESGVSIDDLIIGGLLEGQPVEARKPMKQVLQCTSSSWNATGSMLGVTYGKNDVYGWCDVPGALCCWNIFNKTLDPTSPDIIIDHSSCLMSVTFHPIIPSIVAIGSYNGELMIYDLLHPEKAFAISPVIEYSHKEPIIDIKWMKSSSSSSVTMNTNDLDSWNIITSSIDGRILFWNISNKLQLPYKGYLLSNKLSQNKVELMRNIRGSHSLMNSSITSLSLSSSSYITNYMSQSNNNFINLFTPKWMMVGEANGEIIRCQVPRLPNKVITPEVIKSYPLVEEVFSSLNKKEEPFGHQPHIGAVSCMDWSPFHRNLFLTGGADGVVKLFHILEQQPLYRWEPASASQLQVDAFQFISITSVKFSPHRPTVFAASGSNGMIYIYDLSENTTLPITVLEANDQLASTLLQSSDNNGNNNTTKKSSLHNSSAIQSKNSIVSIAFNHKQRDLFAASDWYGKVFVWRLSWQLANRKSNEVQTLNSLAQSSMSSGSGSGSNQYN